MNTTNIHIISIIMCLLAFCTATPQAQAAPQKRFTVVIDPGHGGHDPGAVGRRGKCSQQLKGKEYQPECRPETRKTDRLTRRY